MVQEITSIDAPLPELKTVPACRRCAKCLLLLFRWLPLRRTGLSSCPEKLIPAIGDTFYMVSITMLCAGLVGLIVGALLYTTRVRATSFRTVSCTRS